MKIFTGNFANINRYVKAGYYPISIARYAKYFHGAKYEKLAPQPWMLKMEEAEYRIHYKKTVTERLNPSEVIKELSQLSGGKDVVLLCYEPEGSFCHRRLVADWLSPIAGEIKELGKMKMEKKKEAAPSLF